LAEEANSLAADIGGWHDLKGCLASLNDLSYRFLLRKFLRCHTAR
jgi:hypothetical protein